LSGSHKLLELSSKWCDLNSRGSCESDFSITEILAIENHKLYDIFLHVAFGSQSLLRTTSDLTDSDTN
jgi:hypothetical protein